MKGLIFKCLFFVGLAVLYASCFSSRAAESSNTGATINQGYSTQSARNKTTAVDTKEVDAKEAGMSMGDLLSKTPGVLVSGSGRNLQIRVRGKNSINQSSEPLFVVDGQIMGNGFYNVEFLDPAMVKSISVLKDAASASAYGSRGLNGVILIDLKKD